MIALYPQGVRHVDLRFVVPQLLRVDFAGVVQGVKEYNVNMAATILTGLVPLIVYFVSGKLFVRDLAAGAVKG